MKSCQFSRSHFNYATAHDYIDTKYLYHSSTATCENGLGIPCNELKRFVMLVSRIIKHSAAQIGGLGPKWGQDHASRC